MAVQLQFPEAVVSHHAALHLYGILPEYFEPIIEVTVPPTHSVRVTGATAHTSDRIERVQIVDGLRVTNPARTIIDTAHMFRVEWVIKQTVESALFARLTSFSRLRAEMEAIAKRGRRGVAYIRALLDEYSPLDDQASSPLERKLLRALTASGLPEPTPQFQVKASGQQYFLDFAYPELKIGIEAHSVAWHTRLTAFEKDAERDGDLSELGWTVFYVTDRAMPQNVERIKRVVRQRTPPFFLHSHTA